MLLMLMQLIAFQYRYGLNSKCDFHVPHRQMDNLEWLNKITLITYDAITQASLAQSAARQSHNLKVVSSILTRGRSFYLCFKVYCLKIIEFELNFIYMVKNVNQINNISLINLTDAVDAYAINSMSISLWLEL